MPLVNHYNIFLELHDSSGKIRYQFPVESFRNCLEDFKFSAIRKGLLKNNGFEPVISLEPLWEEEGKSPNCYGFRLCFENKKTCYKKAYSKMVFKYQIYRVVRALMENHALEESVELKFRMLALLNQRQTMKKNPIQDPKFSMTSLRQPLPIGEQSLKQFSRGKKLALKGEMPVWIAEHVVREMIVNTLANKESERAGFLLGHVCQDPESRAIFLVGHAQIIARDKFPNENSSSLTHFQFSPEIFCEVQRVIALRNKSEIVLGWWHSHPWPFTCQKGKECKCTSLFFSEADVSVMEAAFSAPYQVAIVIGRASTENMEAKAQMYGWRNGLIEPREFYQFDATNTNSKL